MFRKERHKASSTLQDLVQHGVEQVVQATENLDHVLDRIDHATERLAALAPEFVGNEIMKHANIHLTIALLQQIITREIDFDSATTAQKPAANKSVWDTIKDVTNNAEIWGTSDSVILKISGLLPQTPPAEAIPVELTIDVSRTKGAANQFTLEILEVSNTKSEVDAPAFVTTQLKLKVDNGSLIPMTEHCELRGRLLRDYQAEACKRFAESLIDGRSKRFGEMGAGSGKGSILAAIPSWLRHTAGQHGNFICILPNNTLATQYKNDDVRNSDKEMHDSLVISSDITSMDEWKRLCTSSGRLLVLDRSDKKYEKKLKTALANAAMVFIDEAHEIENAKEWALIHECPSLFAVSATPSQVMQKAFNDEDPVVTFSTSEAINRKIVRGLELADLGNNVPNDRLFLNAYHNYVGMTSIDTSINTRLFALAQKSFVFCLDTPAEAQKILEQLNGFANRDPNSNQSERTKLQLNLMGAKKTVDAKARKRIIRENSIRSAREKIAQWETENSDRSINIRDFEADIQYAQQEQLAATINAIAMQALFPAPNKGFDFYQEQIVSRKFKKTLAEKERELAVFRKWRNEKNDVKKAALFTKNPCIQTLYRVLKIDGQALAESINTMITDSALPEAYQDTLVEACIKTAKRLHDAMLQDEGSLGDAFIQGSNIDLVKFRARYAELVLEDMSDDEAKKKLALLNYGFTMNLISQGLHSDKLNFSTGTSIPSVLGVIVAGGSQSNVLSDPKIITQMLARGIRGPNGACFMVISTNTHGRRPLVNLADLTPLQVSVAGVSREAYRRSDQLAERKEEFLTRKNVFTAESVSRRTQSEAPQPDPTRFFVGKIKHELNQRFRAATAPAAVTLTDSQVAVETSDLRSSMRVTMMLEQYNSERMVTIDVDSSYSDSEDDDNNRSSLKNSC